MKEEKHKADMEQSGQKEKDMMSRRKALKIMAVGGATLLGGYYGLKNGGSVWAGENGVPAFFSQIARSEMAQRKDNTNGDMVSLLGFGCMRFPTKGREVDEQAAREMVDYAYRHGVNYFDTAYPYHNGKSETVIGKILKEYPRNTFFLADKMPTWIITDLQKAKDVFQEQLDKCQVTYFDYYLLHSLGNKDDFQKKYIDTGALDYLREEKKKGRIRHLGFSFHGGVEFFEELLNTQQWDFVQIQYNYVDVNDSRQQSGRLLELLKEHKLQAVIMEPLKGGSLAVLNKGCVKLMQEKEPGKSIASWALRYAATPDNVLTVLSGMTLMEHVVDNVKTASGFEPVTESENQFLLKMATAYKDNRPIDCTQCDYCMPCKYGVNIPGIFAVYNQCVSDLDIPNPKGPHDGDYNKKKRKFMALYNKQIDKNAQADHCIACKECAPKCTQRLHIDREISRINNLVKELKKNN